MNAINRNGTYNAQEKTICFCKVSEGWSAEQQFFSVRSELRILYGAGTIF